MKNITLTADDDLIAAARERALSEGTTLNEQFRLWLEQYARKRQSFGKPLVEHEGVGFKLADNEIDLHTARLAIWHCAWVLDQGGKGRHESSLAKVFCSEAEWRVVDRSVQILGASGVSGETIVSRIFTDMRGFQIYDGPSEVHRWSMAKRIARL